MKALVEPSGWLPRIFLCFVATAGVMYVNIMPALIDALQAGLGFSIQEAGRIGSTNTYGGALGAGLMALIARRLPWRQTLALLCLGMMTCDATCLLVRSGSMILGLRFAEGVFGGGMVAMAYLVIGRNHNPGRTFGNLMVLQYGLYVLTMALMPSIVRAKGIVPLFWLLAGCSGLALAFVMLLPESPQPKATSPAADSRHPGLRLCALAAVLLFQSGIMMVSAFSVSLGLSGGLPLAYVTQSLSAAGLAGLVGGVVAMFVPSRRGFVSRLVGSMLLAAGSVATLCPVKSQLIWRLGIIASGFAWAMVLSQLFSKCAGFDSSGSDASWSSFMSLLGLATGPMLGSIVLGTAERYQGLVTLGSILVCLGLLAAVPPLLVVDGRATGKRCARTEGVAAIA